jgi:hypothetical protein
MRLKVLADQKFLRQRSLCIIVQTGTNGHQHRTSA